jgi:hypothetical protein
MHGRVHHVCTSSTVVGFTFTEGKADDRQAHADSPLRQSCDCFIHPRRADEGDHFTRSGKRTESPVQ